MDFPVYIGVGTFKVHPHLLFESLAYTCGFLVYMRMRTRRGDVVSDSVRWSIVAAAGVGAAVGTRLLF